MWVPKSTGKSVSSYLADEVSKLDRASFEKSVREEIGLPLAARLVPDDFQVLFEISDEYLRTYSAIELMKKQKLTTDWKRRAKVMATTETSLADLQNGLKARIADLQCPVTGLLAQSISVRLSKLQGELNKEFEAIRNHRKLSEGMLRALHLKNLRHSYVARLNSYGEDVVARLNLKQKSVDNLIAAVMSAAGLFTKAEKENDIEGRIPMARSRAQSHIKQEILDRDEFPVFQRSPKRKSTV